MTFDRTYSCNNKRSTTCVDDARAFALLAAFICISASFSVTTDVKFALLP